MVRYYVEVQRPDATQAEASAERESFDEALAWLDQRFAEDPRHIRRFMDRQGHITAEQAVTLARLGIERT